MPITKPYRRLMFALTLLLGGVTAAGGRAFQDPPSQQLQLSSAIAFVSTRDDPTGNPASTAELYVANYTENAVPAERLTNLRRLTENTYADAFPALSPDGGKLVFDSNRLFATPALNTADLFVMDWDGDNVAYLTRGSSATWSPDGKTIAYHRSASGTGAYIRADPGSATIDSEIFVINVDDAAKGIGMPVNLTNTVDWIDDDPDWSPDGSRILYTRHAVTDNHANPLSAEIWVMNADGAGQTQLTSNGEEERGPAWSPDGTRIAYACRLGAPPLSGRPPTFEICVMDANGGNVQRLTTNTVADLTPTWSPDGQRIVFHSASQLAEVTVADKVLQLLTGPPGLNLLANWGNILVKAPKIANP